MISRLGAPLMAARSFVFSLLLLLGQLPALARAQTSDTGFTPPPLPAAHVLRSWQEAKALMLASQPSLQQQRAALTRAEASVEQTLSELLPRLDLGVGADYSLVRPAFVAIDRPAEHELFDGRSLIPNATATFSITFSLASLAQLDSANAGVSAEQHGLAATRHGALSLLASTVLGVLGAERVAARNLTGFLAAQERMRLTERLVALGKATALDTLRFAQDLSEAKSEVLNANEALAQAREALGSALGLREPASLTPDFAVPDLLSASGCQRVTRIEERPELQATRERALQAEHAARSAGLAYLPELRFTSQYVANYAPTSAVTFNGQRGVLHNWGASANLVWTAFEGGSRAAATSRAQAERLDADAGARAAAIAAAGERRSATRLLSVAEAKLTLAEQSATAAREVDRLARKALELGNASALEVVDAARRLRALEITLAVREVELLAAKVRAQLALTVCR